MDVTVQSSGGTSATSSADQFTYYGSHGACLRAASRTSGRANQSGTTDNVFGAGFTGFTILAFSGTSGQGTFEIGVSSTQVLNGGTEIANVTVPSLPAGTYDVMIVTSQGYWTDRIPADQYTATLAPVILIGTTTSQGPLEGPSAAMSAASASASSPAP